MLRCGQNTIRVTLPLGIALFILTALTNCGGRGVTENSANSKDRASTKTEEPARPVDKIVEAIREGKKTIAQIRELQSESLKQEFQLHAKAQGRFEKPLLAVYEAIDFEPFYASSEEQTAANYEIVKDFVLQIEDHGLKSEPYKPSVLEETYASYETSITSRAGAAEHRDEALRKDDGLIHIRKALYAEEGDIGAMVRAGNISNADLKDVSTLISAELAWLETGESVLQNLARVDVIMTRTVMQAVLDFRFVKKVHPFESLEHVDRAPDYYAERLSKVLLRNQGAKDETPEENEEEPKPEAKKKKKKSATAIFSEYITPRTQLSEFLKEQLPPFPMYQATVLELKRYRALAEEAEQNPPPKLRARGGNLRKGQRGPEIAKLRARLAFEGYGDLPDPEQSDKKVLELFDSELEKQVLAYQQTHQLDEKGTLTRSTRSSLNRSFSLRAKQLELGLQRYRESMLNRDRPEIYLRVNIPQFEVQFWETGTLKRRHRVVVGNNTLVDKVRKNVIGYLNRTRMFRADVRGIVLNPYWRVPARIKKLELDAELIDNPDFYERNRYEVKTSGSGRESVRQMPGDENALGRVKINFPNPHAIYMHDTPSKKAFKLTIRAKSHGCMRLQDPLDMAQFLLERDRGYSPEKFKEHLDKFKERSVSLKTPVPIFVEYNVTATDEEGRAMFLTDIYRYDKAVLNDDLPVIEQYRLDAYKKGRKIPHEGILKVRSP